MADKHIYLGKNAFKDKWSPEISVYGFTQIPNLLIECQGHLGISNGELVTLLQLLKFWYEKNSRVYPSIETLCKYSGNGYSTVQKRLTRMEEKGFISKLSRNCTSNEYQFTPLLQKMYKHQATCSGTPRKQGEYWDDLKHTPSPYYKTEEYEALRSTMFDNTENRRQFKFESGQKFSTSNRFNISEEIR